MQIRRPLLLFAGRYPKVFNSSFLVAFASPSKEFCRYFINDLDWGKRFKLCKVRRSALRFRFMMYCITKQRKDKDGPISVVWIKKTKSYWVQGSWRFGGSRDLNVSVKSNHGTASFWRCFKFWDKFEKLLLETSISPSNSTIWHFLPWHSHNLKLSSNCVSKLSSI